MRSLPMGWALALLYCFNVKHLEAPPNSEAHAQTSRSRVWLGRSLFSVVCFASGIALTILGAHHFDLVNLNVSGNDGVAIAPPQEDLLSDIQLNEPTIKELVSEETQGQVTKLTDLKSDKKTAKKKAKKTETAEAKSEDAIATASEQNLAPEAKSLQSRPIEVSFDREKILNDYDNRISDQFSIPPGLRDRAGFWFDVYTKYDSNRRIIHHSRFPWIIYKVVDVSPIINSDTPKRRWMRNEKADKFVKAEAEKIRSAIQALAHGKAPKNEYETLVAESLSRLGGPLKKQAAAAVGNTRVQMGQKDFFEEGLEISPRYLGGMEEIFRANKLPVELTRLPFVESSFNKHATSKVGATGIWQFMGNTGRKFMVVNDHIDERRSPFKATEAAAKLLKENHMILHRSWPLAITAWNHGPGGVRKAIAGAGSKDLAVIVSKYRSKMFDFASSNFYCEFLGALHAQVYNQEIYGDVPREKPWLVHEVKLAKSVSIKEVIKKSGLTSDEFLLFNPDLRKAVANNVHLPSGFRLMLTNEARAGLDRLVAANSIERGSREPISEENSSIN